MSWTTVKDGHECDVPYTGDVRKGTIIRCDECRQKWRHNRFEWVMHPWWTAILHPRRTHR